MYVSISRLAFEDESTAYDNRELLNLIKKLKIKFPISVRMGHENGEQGRVLYFTYVHESPQKVHGLIDKIIDFCENSGFGRIESEDSFLEHFDTILEES